MSCGLGEDRTSTMKANLLLPFKELGLHGPRHLKYNHAEIDKKFMADFQKSIKVSPGAFIITILCHKSSRRGWGGREDSSLRWLAMLCMVWNICFPWICRWWNEQPRERREHHGQLGEEHASGTDEGISFFWQLTFHWHDAGQAGQASVLQYVWECHFRVQTPPQID